ncbi:MAG: glycosyltransferase family 4 protein [Chloroflexi bacterium]|nr:glycosyltransferase family 4 protein [Chloroflexota bacterium]
MPDTITIVVPWFGPDTAGGAETQARQLAVAIHALGEPIEVWASNGRDSFSAPDPYYATGPDVVDGVAVRRFPITPPRPAPHHPYVPPAVLRRGLPAGWPAFPDHELRLLASLASSDELLEAVAAERNQRRFIFVPYPFPTSFWGTLLAGERGYLLPCLHDEPYARYTTYRWMFHHTRRALANSPAERTLALRLYNLPPERVVMAGEGIDLTPRGDGAVFRQRHGLVGPVLRYAGRRDAAKNFPLLLMYLREYWARRGTSLKLVLTGRDTVEIPPPLGAIVLDLGDVSLQERHDAYAAADVFIQPSIHESFSIVLMESWLQGVPALVNAHCDVTREAVEASGGGLSFDGFREFAAALDILLADRSLRRELGERGRAWVLEHCRWEDVARRTVAALRDG